MKDKFLPAFMLCSLMIVAVPAARAQSKLSGSSSVDTGDTGSPSVDLPPLPHSKSTTFGGEIQRVDPVRDELVLKVYGEKPMKIWFDERTLFYLDGNRIALHELHPESHAAVETTLDGASIFAVSIHALSHPPEGDYQGRVMSYDPASRTLTLNSSASREPFKVQVAADATFAREGQPDFTSIPSGASDLQTGSVVSIEFDSGHEGHGVASKITVFAVPGSTFDFTGDISVLDLGSGSLVLVDPRDQKTYQISFDPSRMTTARDLHLGEHVGVKAGYDGIRYVASLISAE